MPALRARRWPRPARRLAGARGPAPRTYESGARVGRLLRKATPRVPPPPHLRRAEEYVYMYMYTHAHIYHMI